MVAHRYVTWRAITDHTFLSYALTPHLSLHAARTTGASLQRGPTSPGGTGMRPHLPDRMMSPTEELRDLHLTMLTKQLADLQKRVKELEGDNLRLREQVGRRSHQLYGCLPQWPPALKCFSSIAQGQPNCMVPATSLSASWCLCY